MYESLNVERYVRTHSKLFKNGPLHQRESCVRNKAIVKKDMYEGV